MGEGRVRSGQERRGPISLWRCFLGRPMGRLEGRGRELETSEQGWCRCWEAGGVSKAEMPGPVHLGTLTPWGRGREGGAEEAPGCLQAPWRRAQGEAGLLSSPPQFGLAW